MPKIPTYNAQGRITAEGPGVKTGIQISPRSSVAAALVPAANELANYSIKKRDNTEKLEANKTLLELKAEQQNIIESQKDNPNDEESINNYKTKFTPILEKTLSTIKNRRVKELIKQGADLENSESIYHLKTNSFKAYEKQSVKVYNDKMNIGVNKYKATDNPILKVKYKQEFYRDAEEFNKEHMLGANDLKKRKEAIDSVLFLSDADSFIGLPNAEQQINNLDQSLKGDSFLSNEDFNKNIYDSYVAKINSLAVEGDPGADYDEAIRLTNELEKFKRYNGSAVVSGKREQSFAVLKEKILGESIRHEGKVEKIIQGNKFFEYSNGQKKLLEATFFNAFDAKFNKAVNKERAFEAGQEYEQRINDYASSNPDATYSEQQQYSRELRMNIADKYEEIDIEKVTAFNLTDNKFNITRELGDVVTFYENYKANPKAKNILKTLAKLNGYVQENGEPDVNGFFNVYSQILKTRKEG
jgi:sulfur relay (sulfurtransferase) DsrC/TusE family protein